MYLKKLSVSRFRSCKETEVELQQELTVLVGENNSGKSNILDTIRLLTVPLSGRRERYAEDSDVRRKSNPDNFQIIGEYSGLSDTLKGLLITAIPDPTTDSAIFGCGYDPKPQNSIRGRFTSWAGKFNETEPETGSTNLVRHVYLPALRDAQQALGSGATSRIMSLFRHFLKKEDEDAFLASVKRSGTTPDVLVRMNDDINRALKELTSGIRSQSAEVNFAEQSIQDIARDLRFKLGDAGVSFDDIRTSGLGYANILYMATVIVELARAQEADLTLFLVEEPEAHLHPQLQILVLEFLLSKASDSVKRVSDVGQPEGRIQVVVSTHSPNLTASVNPKHLVVIRSQQEPDEEQSTVCIPIASLDIDEQVIKKVDRYIDVTRSSLLFGSRAILVEGIAEALLLPVIAKNFTLRDDKEAWLRFRGTVIIPIDGVDFRPYVELLLRPHKDNRIADNLVVVTDADPKLLGNRKIDLEEFATELGANENLHVYTNEVTLEHELYSAGNGEILKQVFLRLHPRSENKWNEFVGNKSEEEQAQGFVDLLIDSSVRKGDFAQELSSTIENDNTFIVPEYLNKTILQISGV